MDAGPGGYGPCDRDGATDCVCGLVRVELPDRGGAKLVHLDGGGNDPTVELKLLLPPLSLRTKVRYMAS